MTCNRREFLIRVGIVRPPMTSAEQKARFVAECLPHPVELFHAEHDRPDIQAKARVARSAKVPALGSAERVLLTVAAATILGSLAWIALVGASMAWL